MLSKMERKIYMASTAVDFRLSIDGFVKLITEGKAQNPHDGSIFVFYNKQKNKIKLLFWDKNGFVLYYKRLDNGKFFLKDNCSTLTQEQLDMLLTGYNPKYLKDDQNGIHGQNLVRIA